MNVRAVLTEALTLFMCLLFALWLLCFVLAYVLCRVLRWVFTLPTRLLEGRHGQHDSAGR